MNFKLSLNIPEGASEAEAMQYIFDAVTTHAGGLHPEDPFFKINKYSVSVGLLNGSEGRKGTVVKHRCYKIPSNRLDLFLTALYMNFSVGDFVSEAKYIFQTENGYDVVVGFNQHRDDFEEAIEQFIRGMNESTNKKST